MNGIKVLIGLILVLVAGLAATGYVSATPSASFHEVNGEVFDEWGVCRTRAFGEDGFYQVSEIGFRPVIVFESLGEGADLAYNLGKQMTEKYADRVQRAEAIFRFVRDRVSYATDVDQFRCEEFAQNADELAMAISQDGISYGDCEDSAVLLAVMYKGAGYRSAIAIGDGHTVALVYLPDYKRATMFFKLGGELGWVWAEATGRNNSLGAVPREFIDARLAAYEVSAEPIVSAKIPTALPAAAIQTGGGTSAQPFPFFGIIGLLWFMSLFRRRRRPRRTRR